MSLQENRPDAVDIGATEEDMRLPDDCAADIVSYCSEQVIAYDDLLEYATLFYLQGIDTENPPARDTLKYELLTLTNRCIDAYNLGKRDPNAPAGAKQRDAYPDQKQGVERYKRISGLHPMQIAVLLYKLHHAVCVCWASVRDEGNYDIGIYQTEGDNMGCYDTSFDGIERLIRRYNKAMSIKDVAETVAVLRAICPRVERCRDRDLVAVNNGIYDYGNKILMAFDPDFVFTSKSHVNFVDGAKNPVIHNSDDDTDWDVVSWMNELSDDPEIVRLLWEIIGAVIRPNVSWNKSAWFYSTLGNNGKGTLCVLMRNLCGPGAWESIPLKNFSEQFMLEPLTRVSAIITDENDTGTFVDDAAALKCVITHDPFQINRKFKDPRSLLFRGFMVQCVNEMPKLKDKSESMYRRLLVIPFDKRFQGRERKYIKDDYLYRQDVLEYVLYHVLAETDYYELDEPTACVDLLEDYKSFNDPVRQFTEDTLPRFSWDLIPWDWLYRFYEGWYRTYMPSGKIQSKKGFLKDFRQVLEEYPDWTCSDNQVSTSGRMDYPEPLILEYDVKSLMKSGFRGSNLDQLCSPDVPSRARGLLRTDNAVHVRRTVVGDMVEDDGAVEKKGA